MFYLVDTNVLLRYAAHTQALNPVVRAAVQKLQAAGHTLQATAQNFVEFWNTATRPVARNGFGLAPPDADQELRTVERIFTRLDDDPVIYPEWRRLVVLYGVSGVKVHDARLVAFMLTYGVTHILTFNTTDFVRYSPEGIVAVDPRMV